MSALPDNLNEILSAFLVAEMDDYQRLNQIRDWVNAHCPDFELYLEDVWNDNVAGETHFEYILRSRITKDETPPIGYDVYKNHQDKNGVWHLDDYTHTVVTLQSPAPLIAFMRANQ